MPGLWAWNASSSANHPAPRRRYHPPAGALIERITRPTLTGEGRKAPALRFGDLRVQALAGATAATLFTVTGITTGACAP
jgi:hypothetical protein